MLYKFLNDVQGRRHWGWGVGGYGPWAWLLQSKKKRIVCLLFHSEKGQIRLVRKY